MMTLLVGRRPTELVGGFRDKADKGGSGGPEAPQTELIVPDLERRFSRKKRAFQRGMEAMRGVQLRGRPGNQSTRL
jgi:hypothetical protein